MNGSKRRHGGTRSLLSASRARLVAACVLVFVVDFTSARIGEGMLSTVLSASAGTAGESGTSISTGEKMVTLISQDRKEFKLSVKAARDCSVMVKDMLGEEDDDDEKREDPILSVTLSVLEEVFKFCEEGTDANLYALLSKSPNLYALLDAADYLHVQKLIDAIDEYLKDKISKIGAIPQVIRSFNIFDQDKVDCNDDTERCGFCTKRVVPYSDPTDAKKKEAEELLPDDPTQNRHPGALEEIARHYFQGLEMCNAVAERMKLSTEKREELDGQLRKGGGGGPFTLLEMGALPDFAKSTPDIALSIFGPNGVGAQEKEELIRAFIHTMWIPNSLKTKEDKMCALALRYVLTPRADSGVEQDATTALETLQTHGLLDEKCRGEQGVLRNATTFYTSLPERNRPLSIIMAIIGTPHDRNLIPFLLATRLFDVNVKNVRDIFLQSPTIVSFASIYGDRIYSLLCLLSSHASSLCDM